MLHLIKSFITTRSGIVARVALSLGGNLGDVKQQFRVAVKGLEKHGMTNIVISSAYTTTPVGCKDDTPDFVNAALIGEWNGTPEELYNSCKELECEAGRPLVRERNADRPLDLDILFFGDLIHTCEKLTIPHRDVTNRLFVLIPLVEIDSSWIHPEYERTVKVLLDSLSDDVEYQKIASSKSPII